jgi:hypothetical protein
VSEIVPVVALDRQIPLEPLPVVRSVEVLLDVIDRRPDNKRRSAIFELGRHLRIEWHELSALATFVNVLGASKRALLLFLWVQIMITD